MTELPVEELERLEPSAPPKLLTTPHKGSRQMGSPASHSCTDGWIIADGIVVDRCMVCNEPPWYREQRRRRIIERFWPLVFVGTIYGLGFLMVWAIAIYQRVLP